MNKCRWVAIITAIELVLVVQSVRAQGGGVSAIPVSSQISPVPRVRAPLTVLHKPIVAQFDVVRREKSREGTAAADDFQLRGKFYRDRNGSTRADYFDLDPAASTNSIAVSFIWSAENKTTNLLSFAERTVEEVQGPPLSPSEDKWMPNGRFVLKFTNQERTIHGLECRRVSLLPIPNQATENLQGETWVALDWGLVMLDVLETSTEELRWEVVRVDRTEPDASVFTLPEGFTVKQ